MNPPRTACDIPPTRLALFDIDGTLLSTRGLGREAMARALTEVYGVPDPFDRYSLAGRTDTQIIRETLRLAGLPDRRIADGLDQAMTRHAEILDALFRERGDGHLMPGILPLLDRLGSDPGWGVGLLTGNSRRGARIKLSFFGLWGRFSFGAFGDDREDRNALPAVARSRARERLAADVPPEACCVIGDTTLDIACARSGGMRAVAVATGWDSYETLERAGPDLLFRTLEDVDASALRMHEICAPVHRRGGVP